MYLDDIRVHSTVFYGTIYIECYTQILGYCILGYYILKIRLLLKTNYIVVTSKNNTRTY